MGKRVERHEKDHLDKTIGKNIRLARYARDMTRDELAQMMGLTVSHMGLMERGERGATAVSLSKLSRIFDMPVDKFFVELNKEDALVREGQEPDAQANRMKIKSFITTLSARDLKLVISLIKGLQRTDGEA